MMPLVLFCSLSRLSFQQVIINEYRLGAALFTLLFHPVLWIFVTEINMCGSRCEQSMLSYRLCKTTLSFYQNNVKVCKITVQLGNPRLNTRIHGKSLATVWEVTRTTTHSGQGLGRVSGSQRSTHSPLIRSKDWSGSYQYSSFIQTLVVTKHDAIEETGYKT